jgi:hypothetical protein
LPPDFNLEVNTMPMHPDRILKVFVNELFHSRRPIVGIFVFVNAAMLAAGLQWPKIYIELAILPPAPNGIQFVHFVLGGILLGILIPLGLIFARLQLDPRIRMASAISTTHNIPIIAVVPHLWTPGELKGLRWELLLLALAVVATVALSVTFLCCA